MIKVCEKIFLLRKSLILIGFSFLICEIFFRKTLTVFSKNGKIVR